MQFIRSQWIRRGVCSLKESLQSQSLGEVEDDNKFPFYYEKNSCCGNLDWGKEKKPSLETETSNRNVSSQNHGTETSVPLLGGLLIALGNKHVQKNHPHFKTALLLLPQFRSM